jgi:hypothetical protein
MRNVTVIRNIGARIEPAHGSMIRLTKRFAAGQPDA